MAAAPTTTAQSLLASVTARAVPLPGTAAAAGQSTSTSTRTNGITSTQAVAPLPAPGAATGTAGAQGAQQGAAQAQGAEPFNAPPLDLPKNATTRDVLTGLTKAMAAPGVNQTTAQRLYQVHQQLFEMEKGMFQTILNGMSA